MLNIELRDDRRPGFDLSEVLFLRIIRVRRIEDYLTVIPVDKASHSQSPMLVVTSSQARHTRTTRVVFGCVIPSRREVAVARREQLRLRLVCYRRLPYTIAENSQHASEKQVTYKYLKKQLG
jgi:hypothetical protein